MGDVTIPLIVRATLASCELRWKPVIRDGDRVLSLVLLPRDKRFRRDRSSGVKGRSELPTLVEDYLSGTLKVDEFVTHRKTLAEINEAFEVMKQGDCIRAVYTPFLSPCDLRLGRRHDQGINFRLSIFICRLYFFRNHVLSTFAEMKYI